MIEDKKLGIKWAESEEESEWYQASQDLKQGIEMLKSRIKRAKQDLKMTDRLIAKRFREGAKAVVKKAENSILIQQKFLQFPQKQHQQKQQ